jgi:hypothetical protein
MFIDSSILTALTVVGAVGGIAGLVGGFMAGADSLISTFLMGVIGGVTLSAILRIAGIPTIYGVGAEDFSLVWGALGGLLLGYVVGRSNV